MASKSKPVVLTREALVRALYTCGRTLVCAGEICPVYLTCGANCHNDLRLLAAYMLQHDLQGLTEEQIKEVLYNA